MEQRLVETLAGFAGRDAELLGEEHAEVLVGTQGFGAVSLGGEGSDQQAVSTLAERCELHEEPSGVASGGELGSPESESGRRVGLERPEMEVFESVAHLIDPDGV